MLLYAALLLILCVVGGAVALIVLDMEGRPPGQWFRAIKEWQQTLGAILGFLGAAGVLVLSNEIQATQRATEQARAGRAIGYGLALETEQLSNGVMSLAAIADMIQSQPTADPNRTCTEFVKTIQRVLLPKTPVYDAVLGHLVDFGDDNLSVFVRFYASYTTLLQESVSFDERRCQGNPGAEVAYVRSLLRTLLLVYGMISDDYGTMEHPMPPEPAEPPAAKPMTTMVPPAPATTPTTSP